MWFPLGRRGEFCADITVFRRSPGRAIWIWLTDLNLNNGQLGGGEGFPRSERRFLRSWPGPVYAYPWSGSLSSPARTTDRILLAAHAVEHQEWPISLAVPSGFYAPFFFFFCYFSLMAPVGSILRPRDVSLAGALSLHRQSFPRPLRWISHSWMRKQITLPSKAVRGMVGLLV